MTRKYIEKLLVLCPYPMDIAPSQRFRFEHYLPNLSAAGIDTKVSPFLTSATMQVLYKKGYWTRKTIGTIAGFLRRLRVLATLFRYDCVYIHREAAPIGPPIIEYIISKLGIRIVYDFDDAIFLPKTSEANHLVSFAKWPSKVSYIARIAWRVSVSNTHLYNWAHQFNTHTIIVPTTIDLSYHRPVRKIDVSERKIIIGWTGSHSTAKYLDIVKSALIRLQNNYDFEFRVICDVDPMCFEIKNYVFKPWCLDTEIEDLAAIDIGLMPIPEGAWELGKLGLKAIQYSGVCAVPVVSAIGSGQEVVIDGETGFVVENTTDAWVSALSTLLAAPEAMTAMGSKAREHIRQHYSIEANTSIFLNLFAER